MKFVNETEGSLYFVFGDLLHCWHSKGGDPRSNQRVATPLYLYFYSSLYLWTFVFVFGYPLQCWHSMLQQPNPRIFAMQAPQFEFPLWWPCPPIGQYRIPVTLSPPGHLVTPGLLISWWWGDRAWWSAAMQGDATTTNNYAHQVFTFMPATSLATPWPWREYQSLGAAGLPRHILTHLDLHCWHSNSWNIVKQVEIDHAHQIKLWESILTTLYQSWALLQTYSHQYSFFHLWCDSLLRVISTADNHHPHHHHFH